jgi:putative aldouronate transport system permease protein
MIILTMYVGGGLIPSFLLIKSLGMYNTRWALLIPGAISAYNMIIVRTYMEGISEEIIESTRIDGANDFQIYTKINLPLSKSVIAVIGLFYAVGHWNSYFSAMIYLMDKVKYPLQLVLKEMIVNNDMQGMDQAARDAISGQLVENPTSDMLIAASMVVALIPILSVYPFIQKYFVKGVMIGAVKG